jgi:Methyltransferase domain
MSEKLRRGGTRFKRTWRWSGVVDDWVSARLRTLDGSAPRPIVHVPSGGSGLGDIRIDAHPEVQGVKCDVKADMYRLPLPDQSVGTVICDPPWNLAYDERSKLNHELARVLRDGGLLLFNAPWVPTEVLFEHKEYWLSMNKGGLDRNVSVFTDAVRRPRPTKPSPSPSRARKGGGK